MYRDGLPAILGGKISLRFSAQDRPDQTLVFFDLVGRCTRGPVFRGVP
jgi:hypothetical protein